MGNSKEPRSAPMQTQAEYNESFMAILDRKQLPYSRAALLVLYFLHFTSSKPKIIHYTTKFLKLQYQAGINGKGLPVYDIGYDDIYIVIHAIVFFTFLRSVLMQSLWAPFAAHFFHLNQNAKIRFAEQSWTCFYASSSFLSGFYLFYHSSYWGNLDNVYVGWPHDRMSALFKLYYLAQLGFWLLQIFVLNVEKKRKDFTQMFSHHIITSSLVIGSYYYYYTRIGHLILVIMDFGDIFITSAKILKYAGFNRLCDFMFVCFLVSWIISRHVIYNYLFYHTWFRSWDLMASGRCIEGVAQKRCWTPTILHTFYGLLGGLQIICIMWLASIMKVTYRVISGSGAEDVRSDSEDSDEEVEDVEKAEVDDNEKEENAKESEVKK